jgi:hypothetical protein
MRESWTARLTTGGLVLAAAVAAPGCACVDAMSGTEKGVVAGGLAGAGIGRAIGHHNGNEARGGFAGAALGAVIGGLAGAVSDANRRDRTLPRADVYESVRARPVRVVEVEDEDLPPIPTRTRVVRRVTTTTVYRQCPPPVVEERVVYVIDE